MSRVLVSGSFDDLRSRHIRFLEEAARLGNVHVLLWSDQLAEALQGTSTKFPEQERLYLLQSIRYIAQVSLVTSQVGVHTLPLLTAEKGDIWAVGEAADHPLKRDFCKVHALDYRVIHDTDLAGLPTLQLSASGNASPRKKVIVTGCFDWFHSGHVRFFEEVSALGDLYVVVGNDENVGLLKGAGHPLFPQEERRYLVQAVRFVRQALVSTGSGWMDAAPEIARIRPDIYAVNEDGDKPEKREFCQQHGLEYAVLRRLPKEGLPRRQSTNLRGF